MASVKPAPGTSHGAELARNQREAVFSPIVVVEAADNLPVRSDTAWLCRVKCAGNVNWGETARDQQKAMDDPGGIEVVADDLSPVVDRSCRRTALGTARGTGMVDGGEIARTHQKTVGVPEEST